MSGHRPKPEMPMGDHRRIIKGVMQASSKSRKSKSTNDRGSMAKPLRFGQVNDGGPSDHTRSVQPKPLKHHIVKKCNVLLCNVFAANRNNHYVRRSWSEGYSTG